VADYITNLNDKFVCSESLGFYFCQVSNPPPPLILGEVSISEAYILTKSSETYVMRITKTDIGFTIYTSFPSSILPSLCSLEEEEDLSLLITSFYLCQGFIKFESEGETENLEITFIIDADNEMILNAQNTDEHSFVNEIALGARICGNLECSEEDSPPSSFSLNDPIVIEVKMTDESEIELGYIIDLHQVSFIIEDIEKLIFDSTSTNIEILEANDCSFIFQVPLALTGSLNIKITADVDLKTGRFLESEGSSTPSVEVGPILIEEKTSDKEEEYSLLLYISLAILGCFIIFFIILFRCLRMRKKTESITTFDSPSTNPSPTKKKLKEKPEFNLDIQTQS
jgi:hypothetical protein